jgi:hypothetical protein
MKGHTSDNVLRAHFKAMYADACRQRDRRTLSSEYAYRQYYEGMAAQCVSSAIQLGIIDTEADLKPVAPDA